MIELRQNQVEPVRKAIEFFQQDKPKPSLIVLPTAWGKSILTAFVAKECNDKLIVLQPSKELLEQNYLKYCTLCNDFGSEAGIYSASFGRKEIMPITYATIGSIKNIGAKFKALGFTKMLIDEAHLYPREADSMLGRFLSDSGITHVLGITATPVKLQTNFSREGDTFSKLVMLTSRSKKGNFFKDIIHVERFGKVEDLTFEKGKQWRMFGTGGRLLSGIPIHDIGHYTREDTLAVDRKADAPITIMPFGKYKGTPLSQIPTNYKQWMIRSFDWNSKNEKLRKSIVATM